MPDVSALWIGVPGAGAIVEAARMIHDPSAAAGVPAHVTILYPFVPPERIDAPVEAGLRAITATVEPFEVRFQRTGRFPGVLWLAPEPVEPFRRLTERVQERWPDHPPYAGAIANVIHHLTVADGIAEDELDVLERQLASVLPIAQSVTHLSLGVRRSGTWTVEQRYPLGRIGADA